MTHGSEYGEDDSGGPADPAVPLWRSPSHAAAEDDDTPAEQSASPAEPSADSGEQRAASAERNSDALSQPAPPAPQAYELSYGTPSYEVSPYPTYPAPTYQAPNYQQPAYDSSVYPQPAYDPSAYPQPGYDPSAYPQPTYQGGYQPQANSGDYAAGYGPASAEPPPPAAYPPDYSQQAGYPVVPGGYDQATEYPPRYPIPPAAQQQAPSAPMPMPMPMPVPVPVPQYPEQSPALAPVPPPVPRPEDLLVPNQSPVTTEPASWGWRGRFNRASGGLLKSKAAPDELRARQAIGDIQKGYSRPMTVVVVQPKGGAGKTPTTICLAAAFGAHRGGYVVGWDDNETRGTLAVRVSNPDDARTTVWDLLGDLAAFERFDARVGDLSAYVRSQPDAHFDALVSDDNPGNMAQIGESEFHRLHKVLQRFYRMVVIDTGNNVRSSNWQAAVDAADMVVVVSTYQRDVGYSGSWVLDHLAQTGREELARNAVTILTAADPTTDKTVRDQLRAHFAARTQAIAEIPYDAELAHGGPIRWNQLAPATRNAWIEAGAIIANRLAEQDARELQARRA